MTMNRLMLRTLPLFALVACAGPDRPQVVTGQVALSTFPAQPTAVRALHGGRVVAEQLLGADGRFRLSLPAHGNYHLEVVAPQGRPVVAFPRRTGKVETGFHVGTGSRPYGVGTLRYVGDPRAQTFVFALSAAPAAADCQAGGAVCVNDEGQGDNNQEGVDEPDGNNNQCGVDEPNGDNNQAGTDEPDGENVATDQAVVGDFNLPATLGCDDGGERGD
jgi:hypothetical protein